MVKPRRIILGLLALSSCAKSVETASRLRGLSESSTRLPDLTCRVLAVDSEFAHLDEENVADYACIPLGDDGIPVEEDLYDLNLPDAFVEGNVDILSGGTVEVAIEGGTLVGDGVSIPEGASIRVVGNTYDGPQYKDPSGYEKRSLLVVRVVANDASPSVSASKLRVSVFDDDSLTLRSQYKKCSFGKLEFEAAADNSTAGIQGGVMDLHVSVDAEGRTRQSMTREAAKALRNTLGVKSLTSLFDNVILCHPPGTGLWLAYSFLNYHISVYNDVWCGFVSANIHEVGHNLGLKHSNQNGLYKDQTGYMGFSYFAEKWPAECFNGHKHWQLGWFEDRTTTISQFDETWRGKVAAFVDYNYTASDEYVVVKVGDLYLQYNRGTKFNYQTRELKDFLTIVEERQNGSELMGGVNEQRRTYTYANFITLRGVEHDLVIRVCSVENSDELTNPDYVSIAVGLDEAPCSTTPTQSPAPSLSPSEVPTDSPEPSPSPSAFPSKSARPTWIAPDRGSACDDMNGVYFFPGHGLRDCLWLSKQHDSDLLCGDTTVNKSCRETCGRCSDDCEDDANALFLIESTLRTCAWVARNRNLWDSLCVLGEPAFEHCKESCNSCESNIDGADNCDDTDGTFYVEDVGLEGCIWLAAKDRADQREQLCVPDNDAFHVCPETCGKCFDHCFDDQEAKFWYNRGLRDCDYLRIRTWKHADACARDDISFACQETCDSCVR